MFLSISPQHIRLIEEIKAVIMLVSSSMWGGSILLLNEGGASAPFHVMDRYHKSKSL